MTEHGGREAQDAQLSELRLGRPRTFGLSVMATRRAVRETLKQRIKHLGVKTPGADSSRAGQKETEPEPLVLVALSGGADSLALALALAYEAPKAGIRAGAVIIDHSLQQGSATVAATAAEQARQMGLDPVLIETVTVEEFDAGDGPEAAARNARYAAFARAAAKSGTRAIVTAHTHDDQAEQVLLGLTRGSGLRSLAGMPVSRVLGGTDAQAIAGGEGSVELLRPFLVSGGETKIPAITRATTEAACADQGVEFWRDPQNADPAFARVRVRQRVLPMLETELGPGVADALVRTADLAREDADALDEMARECAVSLLGGGRCLSHPAEDAVTVTRGGEAGTDEAVAIEVADLLGLSKPVLYRVIRLIAQLRFGAYLERVHTLAVAALVTNWNGQGVVYVPGIRVARAQGRLTFERQVGSPRA